MFLARLQSRQRRRKMSIKLNERMRVIEEISKMQQRQEGPWYACRVSDSEQTQGEKNVEKWVGEEETIEWMRVKGGKRVF